MSIIDKNEQVIDLIHLNEIIKLHFHLYSTHEQEFTHSKK